MNIKNISEIKNIILDKSKAIKTRESLDIFKHEYLGKKGLVVTLMKDLHTLELSEKKEKGAELNNLKSLLNDLIAEKNSILLNEEELIFKKKNNFFDVSCPEPNLPPKGNLHFYSKFTEEIEDIFISMGYELFDGLEVVDEYHNFTALNIPEDHPARDMQDTIWIDKKDMLLRTHTSSVQIKAMLRRGAPMAGIATGRVFRQEALDATHEFSFSQLEGIFINENASLSQLFGVTKQALSKIFGKADLDIRIRPGFFPFVVPGIEIDMQCIFCKSGCHICKHTTWIEVAPGGMIHPFVLKSGGIDTKKYSGFAFCFGIERLAMLRHQITDIRLFKSGDIKFLKQW